MNETMQPLSGFDSAFIYLETPNMHMHVGSVSVFEGALEFAAFRDLIAARIHLVPAFRQRLISVPFGLDRPVWVDDPDFNLALHLQHVALPAPGGWAELRQLASRVFSDPLDRGRPLWQMVFVEGLETVPRVPPGSVAVIAKIHHAAIDGVSGADIMGLLYDVTPEGREIEPPAAPFDPPPIPNDLRMLLTGGKNLLFRPIKIPRLAMTTAKSVLGATYVQRIMQKRMPTLPFQAPDTPLNDVVSAQRTWNTALLSLDRVKEIKNRAGVTVNDVVLAICSGALRSYLQERDALPDDPLVICAPVSVRSKSQKNAMGNQIAVMFVQLPTNEPDPVAGMQTIQRNTRIEKAYQSAVSANWLLDYAEFVPFGLANEAARLYTQYRTVRRHRPIFNLIITNVPGPQVPLYLAGKRLLAVMGTAPVGDGLSTIITVLSYNGILSISPTAGANIMPDMERFIELIRESADKLEAAVLEQFPPADEQVSGLPTAEAYFAHVNTIIQSDSNYVKPTRGYYEYCIVGETQRVWTLNLKEAPGGVIEGAVENPDVVFEIKESHFRRLIGGELDTEAAFMQGKLKVEGDLRLALRLGPVMESMLPVPMTVQGGVGSAETHTKSKQCTATIQSGRRCKNRAVMGATYCRVHAK